MIEALNFKRLQEEVHDRYEYNEQCIVGIIFARYDLQHVQRIIEENYLYWNYNTKRYLDIFWAGLWRIFYARMMNQLLKKY